MRLPSNTHLRLKNSTDGAWTILRSVMGGTLHMIEVLQAEIAVHF